VDPERLKTDLAGHVRRGAVDKAQRLARALAREAALAQIGFIDAQRVAEACRDAMWANDRASKALGMQIQAVSPGGAVLSMTVREDMLNGHDTCHGGLITTLADSAFAFACNSYNELTVASGFTVDLLAPGRLGDVLTATCHEVSKAGRTGVYDCEVTNQNGVRIAVFRGRSYTVKGKPAVSG
jgi:acyl-CoA thioesterase